MIDSVPYLNRTITTDSFTDITSKSCTNVAWNAGKCEIQFAVNLTDDETQQVILRAITPDSDAETLLRAAYTAYQNNATYLNLSSPTAAQVSAQVAALTRQVQQLIRLAMPINKP